MTVRGGGLHVDEAECLAYRKVPRGLTEEPVVPDMLLAAQADTAVRRGEQIGALAVFADAAAQITGTAIPLDGGWTAH